MAKKIPMRMCLGCGLRQPKREMLRIVRTPEGEIKIDPTGRMNGRGCYICKKTSCMATAVKQKKLSRSFDTAVGPEVYSRVSEEFAEWLSVNGGQNIE